MDGFIQTSLQSFQSDLSIRCEVFALMQELVDLVGSHDLHNQLLRSQANYQCMEQLNHNLIGRIDYLEKKALVMETELDQVKENAKKVREKFVSEIGYFLSENKLNKTLKDRITELEDKLSTASFEDKDNDTDGDKEEVGLDKESSDSVASSEAQSNNVNNKVVAAEAKVRKPPMLLFDMPEESLLLIFSFLETVEVLNYAQVCRYVYRRVDAIFGTESSIVKADWGVVNEEIYRNPPKPVISNGGDQPAVVDKITAVPNSSSQGAEFRLSREMVDVLTKRLNAQEMKVILGLAEKLKKQVSLNDALSAEKEDLVAKLQNAESIKDFLIEKLKTAELAIKSMMGETSMLKKQTASDNEIITYLDLNVQDLEGRIVELTHRSNHLQASLDLQVGTHSLKEEQLTAELNDYKLKYEKLDANFKSQKKLLVKEVKSLRSQVEGLSLERDQHANRFQMLKDALDSTSSNHASKHTSSAAVPSVGSTAYNGYRKF